MSDQTRIARGRRGARRPAEWAERPSSRPSPATIVSLRPPRDPPRPPADPISRRNQGRRPESRTPPDCVAAIEAVAIRAATAEIGATALLSSSSSPPPSAQQPRGLRGGEGDRVGFGRPTQRPCVGQAARRGCWGRWAQAAWSAAGDGGAIEEEDENVDRLQIWGHRVRDRMWEEEKSAGVI